MTILVLSGTQLIAYTFRTIDNRKKAKSRDAIAVVQAVKLDEVHQAVNGRHQEALDKIKGLQAEVSDLRVVIADLKTAVRCPLVHPAETKPPES